METPVACFTRFGAFPRGTVRNALRIFDSLGRNPGEVPPRENNPPDCFLSPLLRLLTLLSSWDSVPHPASLLKEGKYVLQTYSENFPPPTARTCASLLHKRERQLTAPKRDSRAQALCRARAPASCTSVSASSPLQSANEKFFACFFKKEQRAGRHKLSARAANSLFAPKFCGVSRSARLKSSLPTFFQESRVAHRRCDLYSFPPFGETKKGDNILCPTTPTGWNLPGK